MKKLLIALILTSTITSVVAQPQFNTNNGGVEKAYVLTKVIKSDLINVTFGWDRCTTKCLAELQACLNSGTSPSICYAQDLICESNCPLQ